MFFVFCSSGLNGGQKSIQSDILFQIAGLGCLGAWARPPAEGPGAARRGAWGRPNMRLLDKAPTDYTKPQQTIQNPDILDKAPTDNTKPRSPTISNAPAWYGGPPRTGMGVAPDRYGGRPGPVWGARNRDD